MFQSLLFAVLAFGLQLRADDVTFFGNSQYDGASTIVSVTGRVASTDNWIFEGDGGSSTLHGLGGILDITGGAITVNAGHTLYITGLHIKGVGANGGNISLASSTSKVVLSNTTIELEGSFTFTSGTIQFSGDNCKVITSPGEQFIASGSGTTLRIDAVVLWYDVLGGTTVSPFTTNSGGAISNINNGTTRAVPKLGL